MVANNLKQFHLFIVFLRLYIFIDFIYFPYNYPYYSTINTFFVNHNNLDYSNAHCIHSKEFSFFATFRYQNYKSD